MSDSGTTVIDRQSLLSSRFEIVRHLGDGSAGSVYLVRDRERGNVEVALKVLINQSAFDEHTMLRFRKEIEVCQGLHHKNLIQAFDLVELEGTIGFTMEFVQGKDLAKIVSAGKIPYPELDEIFVQLLSGLHELHSRGIVHRDIKLENVLRCDDGTVKISDLGLMKRAEYAHLTRPGILLGTAQYMPPEYIRSSHFDNRGDIYAVGVMLYEILAEKRRLYEMNGMAAIEHLIKTNFELPKNPLFGTPEKYIRIVEKATRLDPKRRYQTALEMLEDFAPKPEAHEPLVDAGAALKPTLKIVDFAEQDRLARQKTMKKVGIGLTLLSISLLGLYLYL
ncbi:MAG: serine/threonine protein kinase [Oligoflexia bacterium]|nr:serine/threonine protein kinase [Oligoflexia bacterium]